MKTLEGHSVIYDSDCPLCNAYTGAFVKTGMLDQQGRVTYNEIAGKPAISLDMDRARNEIALIDKSNGTVTYGMDSLFTIIGHSLPILKPLFRFAPFRFLISHLYNLISYNRKVIAPGKVFEPVNGCTPDMNYTYRWAYIIIAWIFTSVILVSYSKLAAPLFPPSAFGREFLVCAGQLLYQGVVVRAIRKDLLIHYLGNLMTISMIGALLLTPMLLLPGIIQNNWFYITYFMVVVAFMLLLHARRIMVLGLPWFVSLFWISYRFVGLYIILANQP